MSTRAVEEYVCPKLHFILPSGTTDLYLILGDPVAQVQAPLIFNDIFRRAQRDAVMVAMRVTAANLETVFAGLKHVDNLKGIALAIPHKAPMLSLADHASEMARIVGATNAVRRDADGRWFADMFDGLGFVHGLAAAGHAIAGRHALLVGAGGGGSAIAAALLQQDIGRLRLADIDTRPRHRLRGAPRAALARPRERRPLP